MCPAWSTYDAQKVSKLFDEARVFSCVTHDATRQSLLEEVLRTRHLIPSLFCLLENAKWLEGPASVLQALLRDSVVTRSDSAARRSLESRFRDLYDPPHLIEVQTGDFDHFRPTQCVTTEQSFRSGYLQVWLLALRYFPTQDTNKSKCGLRRDQPDRANETSSLMQPEGDWTRMLGDHTMLTHQLHRLCHRLGFSGLRSGEQLELSQASQIEAAMQRAWPPLLYELDSTIVEDIKQYTCRRLRHARLVSRPSQSRPSLTDDKTTAVIDLTYRCGRSHVSTFLGSRDALFLDRIYDFQDNEHPQTYLTSFFCQRDIFHSFFGDLRPSPSVPPALPAARRQRGGPSESTSIPLNRVFRAKQRK